MDETSQVVAIGTLRILLDARFIIEKGIGVVALAVQSNAIEQIGLGRRELDKGCEEGEVQKHDLHFGTCCQQCVTVGGYQ